MQSSHFNCPLYKKFNFNIFQFSGEIYLLRLEINIFFQYLHTSQRVFSIFHFILR